MDSLVSATPVHVAYADVADVIRTSRSRGAPIGTKNDSIIFQ